jgi:hypothetical protein
VRVLCDGSVRLSFRAYPPRTSTRACGHMPMHMLAVAMKGRGDIPGKLMRDGAPVKASSSH